MVTQERGRSTQFRPESKKPTGVEIDEQDEVPLILSPSGGLRRKVTK